MSIKLYVSDMDGSLLDDNKNLPANIDEVIEAIFCHHGQFAIATGRSYVDVASFLDKWIDRIAVIAENGNQVVYKQQQIYNTYLPLVFVKEVHDVFLTIKKGIMIFCGEKGIYRVKSDQVSESDANEITKYYNDITMIDSINHLNDHIMKITVCSVEGSKFALYPTLSQFSDRCEVTLSAHEWMDLTKTGESKGKALSVLQDFLNITKDETVCFGDYLNDISMKNVVKKAYAMKNAHPEVIETFDEVIGSNNEGAVCGKINQIIFEQSM